MPVVCTFKRILLLTAVINISAILGILAILFWHEYPTFVRQRVIDSLIFKNDTPSMDRFKTTKDLNNLRVSFYLYNVTNANEVINSKLSNVKIKVQEVGPFVYSEFKTKDFIDNNQTSGLITYRLRKQYTFQSSLSYKADPTKLKVTLLNAPLIVLDNYIKEQLNDWERKYVYSAINILLRSTPSEQAFITDTVDNFIFTGSERPFFERLQLIDKIAHFIEPWPLPDNRFGFLYGRNNNTNTTKDFDLTTSAGFGLNQTYQDLNKYVYVNYSSKSNAWLPKPPECNKIEGTDGEFFAPFSTNHDEDLKLYVTDLCRLLPLKYRDDTTMYGIPTMRYTLNEQSLKSGANITQNKCFCLNPNSNARECILDGLIDLRRCGNPSIFASGANFWAGSKDLLKDVDGLSEPIASRHEPVILKEPNTGLALNVKVPLQFNIKLEKTDLNIFKFADLSEPIFVPTFWLEEASEMTVEQSLELSRQLRFLDSWFVVMVLGGSILFILVLFAIIIMLVIRYRRRTPPQSLESSGSGTSETDPLISPEVRNQQRSYSQSLNQNNNSNISTTSLASENIID